MTRDEALRKLEQPSLDPEVARQEFEYVAKKLGISTEKLQGYLDEPNRSYRDYKSQSEIYTVGAAAMKMMGLELGGKR
jgi:hypothetical protein